MKKNFVALIIFIASILTITPDTQARQLSCNIAAIFEAAAERESCIDGCSNNSYCIGYCEFYFDDFLERNLIC